MKTPKDNFQFKIALVNEKKVIELLSRPYYQHFLNTKCKVGDIGSMELTFKKPTRTEAQLRYYWVIIGLIADNCGYESEELHDALMILKFGVKKIKVGKDFVEVRKSISSKAQFKKVDMMELIEFSLEKASELGIVVPTRQELGYIDN